MSNITREQQSQPQPESLETTSLSTPVDNSAALNEASVGNDSTPEKSLLQQEVASLLGGATNHKQENNARALDMRQEEVLNANEAAQLTKSQQPNVSGNTTLDNKGTGTVTSAFKGSTRTGSEAVTSRADLEFEIEAEKRRVMLATNTTDKDADKHLRPGENIPLGLNDDNRGNSGFKSQKDKDGQPIATKPLNSYTANTLDGGTTTGVGSNLELAKATLSTLAHTHVKDEVYRENAEKRELEFNETLKELSTTYGLSDGDKRGLNTFYFSEYQRASSARTQTIQGLSFQLEEAGKAHAGDATIRSLNSSERATSVNKMLDRIGKETPLSQAERTQLVALYNGSFDKHNNGAASKENKIVEKIVRELTPAIKRDATTPSGELKTDEVLKAAYLKHASSLNPALEDSVKALYESKLNEARSREYTLATQRLAAQQAKLDLTSRDQLTSEGSKLKQQYSDVTISDKQKDEIFQTAYKNRKDALGGQAGLLDNVKSSFTISTDAIQKLPGVAIATSLAGSVADSLGITNVAKGAWDLASTPFKLIAQGAKTTLQLGSDIVNAATGKASWGDVVSNLGKNLGEQAKILGDGAKGLGNVAWGLTKAVGEFTGVTDLIMAGKYALEGNWAMAGMHAGFAAMSIAALVTTVATGGVGAPAILGVQALKAGGKVVLKTAVKEFVQEAGEKIGKEFIEQVGEVAFRETFEKLGKESAEQGIKEVGEVLAKDTGEKLTKELVQEVQEKVAKEQTEKTLKELGLRKFIDDKVFDLHKVASDPQALSKALKDAGVTNQATRKKIVGEITSVMNSEVADDAVKEILEKSISKPIQEAATEAAEKQFKATYKESLERIAKGQTKGAGEEAIEKGLKENAELLGKNVDEVADDLTEAAWKGQKEGMEKTIQKVVREGIDDAYKRIRDRDSDDAGGDIEDEEQVKDGRLVAASQGTKELVKGKADGAEPPKLADSKETRTIQKTDDKGNAILVTELLDPDTQKWEVLSVTTVQDSGQK
jgi:hypothetical protein